MQLYTIQLEKNDVTSIKEDNIRKFVQVAKLPNNILQDPTKANEVYNFYEKNKYELDGMFNDKEAFSIYSTIAVKTLRKETH